MKTRRGSLVWPSEWVSLLLDLLMMECSAWPWLSPLSPQDWVEELRRLVSTRPDVKFMDMIKECRFIKLKVNIHFLTCPTYDRPGLKKTGVNWLKNKTWDWSTKVTRTSLVTGAARCGLLSSLLSSFFSLSLSLISSLRGRVSSTLTETLISCPTSGSSVFMPKACLISSGFNKNSLWPASSCWKCSYHSMSQSLNIL